MKPTCAKLIKKRAMIVTSDKKPQMELKVIKSIKDKLIGDNLILCKADNDSPITIIDNYIYNINNRSFDQILPILGVWL